MKQTKDYTTVTVWKQITVTGCVYENESDTRKAKSYIFVVPNTQKDADEFGEHMADEYAGQDYSNKVDFIKLFEIDIDEIDAVIEALKKEVA